jgi:nitrate/nitrite transporter NarK
MPTLTRPVLLGLAAFLAWLGVSFLVLVVAGKHLAPFSDSWVVSFPVIAALPALLLAGGVSSYYAGERWVSSSAMAGAIGVLLLLVFATFSGVWWVLVLGALGCVALALGSGYVVQHFLHRG